MAEPKNLLRHVVVFKLKDRATPEHVQEVGQVFLAMTQKIDVIHDLEWGANVSVEGLTQDYTHCLLVTFKNETDREAYLSHPEHQATVASVGQYVVKVLVIDYWAMKRSSE